MLPLRIQEPMFASFQQLRVWYHWLRLTVPMSLSNVSTNENPCRSMYLRSYLSVDIMPNISRKWLRYRDILVRTIPLACPKPLELQALEIQAFFYSTLEFCDTSNSFLSVASVHFWCAYVSDVSAELLVYFMHKWLAWYEFVTLIKTETDLAYGGFIWDHSMNMHA